MFPIALIKAIAEHDKYIREMLELKQLSDKHNIPSRCDTVLQGWTDEWLQKDPRLGAVLRERVSINSKMESQDATDI